MVQQRGLADAWNILDEQMTTSKQAGQGHTDLIIFSQYHLADLVDKWWLFVISIAIAVAVARRSAA